MASTRILIINPNSNQSMTDGLRAPIESLGYNNTTYTYYTAPTGPSSINSLEDALLSIQATLPTLLPLLPHHSAFLIACYSPHPLIPALKSHTHKPIIGIFEASIAAAVQLLPALNPIPNSTATQTPTPTSNLSLSSPEQPSPHLSKFGIVSTATIWGPILTTAVHSSTPGMLGSLASILFAGVETIGIDAGDLHPSPSSSSHPPSPSFHTPPSIETSVRAATRRLLSRGGGDEVRVVVLGCAGMVGMEGWVRGEMEEVGRRDGGSVVVDGVKAGVGVLQGLVRGGF